MLEELAQILSISPPRLVLDDPWRGLERLAAFLQNTDLDGATEDARIWLLNRAGLLIARGLVSRFGGMLAVQRDPAQRFFGNYVVGGMQCPAGPDAVLDPFAVAHAAIYERPRPNLLALVAEAEAALAKPVPG